MYVQPFTNASEWTVTEQSGSSIVNACNVTLGGPTAGGNSGPFMESILSFDPTGLACDIGLNFNISNIDTNFLIGFDDDNIFNNAPGGLGIGVVNGVAGDNFLLYSINDVFPDSGFNPIVDGNRIRNLTIVFNTSTLMTLYLNNSDDYTASSSATALGGLPLPFQFEFTGSTASNLGMQIHSLFCYNASTGSPQIASAIPPTISFTTPQSDDTKNTDPLPIEFIHSQDITAIFSNITLSVNGTINQTITSIGNMTINLSDGLYDFELTINDDIGSDTAISTNVRIDRTNPFTDHDMVLNNGRVLINSENATITAMNSNLSFFNVTVRSPLDVVVFTEQNNDIHTSEDSIIVQIDVATYGIGEFTVISNVSDVTGNNFSTLTTFEIIAPSISTLSCDYGAGFVSCADQTEGISIEQLRSVCLNGTTATATLKLNVTPQFVTLMVKSGDVYTLDNADEVMVINSYNYSVVCSNPAQSVFSQVTFNGLTSISEDEAFGVFGNGLIGLMVTVLSIIIGFGIVKSLIPKRSGVRK